MGLLVKSEKLPSRSNGGGGGGRRGILRSSSSRSSKFGDEDDDYSEDGSVYTTTKKIAYKPHKSRSTNGNISSQRPGPISLKNRIRSARRKGIKGGNVQDLQYLVEEGPLSFRSISFLCGFFMILASVLDWIDAAGDFDPMANLVTYHLWFFGFLVLTLEGRPFHVQIPIIYNILIELFHFFRFVWGRGFFYFIAGCLQFFLFTPYNMVSGVFMMILGVVSIAVGYKASVRLAGLRNTISSKSEIKFMFHSFDRDRDGYLNTEEFRELMIAMGQQVDYNDFVAALSAVDIHNNQQVSYDDLQNWWVGYSTSDLPPGMNCCSNGRYHKKGMKSTKEDDRETALIV